MPRKNKFSARPVGAVYIDSQDRIHSFFGDGDAIGVVIIPEIVYGDTSVKNVVKLIGLSSDNITSINFDDDDAPPTDMTADAAHQLGLILISAAKTIRAAEIVKNKGASRAE